MPVAAAPSLPAPQQVVLDVLRARDLALLAAADLYASAEAADGVALDALLAVEASLGADTRRGLRTVATVLPHLPSLRMAADRAQVGFDVVVGCCRAARTNRLTVAQLGLLDAVIATLVSDSRRWDADDLVECVRDHAIGLRPDEADGAVRELDEVRFWPGLFGDGTVVLDATPETFQLATAVIDATVEQRRLIDRAALRPSDDELAAAANDTTRAQARGAAVAGLLADAAAGDHARGTGSRPAIPAVQVVVDLSTLVGDDDLPARLLSGGRLTAGTLRRMVERDGADVTAVVVDRDHEDAVVGVGRRHRVPPSWLRDLTKALQPRCAIPGCRRRVTDVDHAIRWTDGGRTDLDNLARLCRRHHREKDGEGRWRLVPDAAGAVTVIDAASGWSARVGPATAAPPGTPTDVAAASRRSRQPRLPFPTTRPPPRPVDALPF